MMIVVLPASLTAQSSTGAILRSDTGVWLNGNVAPSSSAIFPNDLIQTQKDHNAKIDADGSTATVQPDTIVQFQGDELVLDHGGVQVNTSRGMKVRVNCTTVTPISQEWTRFDVIDVDGKIRVVAYQNDVKIHSTGGEARRSKLVESSDSIVHQGEHASREERCGPAAKPAEAVDGKAAFLNRTDVKVAGLAALSVIACIGLCHGDDPISPVVP